MLIYVERERKSFGRKHTKLLTTSASSNGKKVMTCFFFIWFYFPYFYIVGHVHNKYVLYL